MTYDEIVDILEINYAGASTIRNTKPIGIYEISDGDLLLKSLLLNKVKVDNKCDGIKLRSN